MRRPPGSFFQNVVPFHPGPSDHERPVETHAELQREIASIDTQIRSLQSVLECALRSCDEQRGRLQQVLAGAEQSRFGVGWVVCVKPFYVEVAFRSHKAVGDSRGLRLGLLDNDHEHQAWSRLFHHVAPTITHDRPFRVRLRRPYGEIADGPTALSLGQYRRLRAAARSPNLALTLDGGAPEASR